MSFINTGVKLDFIVCDTARLNNRDVTNGNFYITKDDREIYVDWDGTRTLMNSIVFADTYEDLCNLAVKNENKIYWERENNCGYVYMDGAMVKVVTPSSEIEESLSEAFQIVWVSSYDDLTALSNPSDHAIYCVPFTPSDGSTQEIEYQQYLYNSSSKSFERIALNYDEVTDIAYDAVEESMTALETDIAAIKDALIADTLEDPSEYYEAISSFYQNVYTKDETYTDDEIDSLLLANANESTALVNSTLEDIKVSSYPYIKSVDAGGTGIVIEEDRAFYTQDTTIRNVVDFTVNAELDENIVISIEVLLSGCLTTAPTYNATITWVDNIIPTYDNDNVLLGFKSFDQGTTWIGFYQGSW